MALHHEEPPEHAPSPGSDYDVAIVGGSVAGAGTGAGKRLPLLQIQTRGAHQSALDKAQRPRPTDQ